MNAAAAAQLVKMAPLKQHEALAALAAAIHFCNRQVGSAASRAVLPEFLKESQMLQRTTSLPAPAAPPACLPRTVSLPSQPIFRGRWADLESEDEA